MELPDNPEHFISAPHNHNSYLTCEEKTFPKWWRLEGAMIFHENVWWNSILRSTSEPISGANRSSGSWHTGHTPNPTPPNIN